MLPHLASRLPLPVPNPFFICAPGRAFVLVGELGPTGVIDWGDICRGDPAIDLMLYWSYVPPAGRPAFRDAYGPVTDAQLVRARVLAVFVSATLALYGHTENLSELAQEALAGLERAAAG
jgi:Phosphotransferase enzyme family